MISKIKVLRELLDNKKVSILELTQEYIEKAKATQKKTNAFTYIAEHEALEAAASADTQEASSPLHGLPYSLKDIISTKGIPTTASSKMLEGYVPTFDATVAERLKASGAILIGKNNCDEFAMGGSNENSAYGVVKNPHNTSKVPGGSSGGSAAAVADGASVFSIGTDTGGSIRQPAAFCGVVGTKVTYGLVPRHGVMAMASSFDTVGPITSSVYDSAVVLDHIAGQSSHDMTSIKGPLGSYVDAIGKSVDGMTIGVPKEYLELLDESMKTTIMSSLDLLKAKGATIKVVSLPQTKHALSTYYILVPAEASSNMSRYDGLRYGPTVTEPKNLEELYLANRTNGLGDEVKRRILLGSFVLSHGYYDAYYLQAQKVRTLIIQDFANAFKDVDVIAGPVTPSVAFDIGGKKDPMDLYKEDVFTIPASCAGIPGMSIPVSSKGGLPIGLQLLAPQQGEGRLFTVASMLEELIGFSL